MIIIHGENQVASRQALIDIKEKTKDKEIIELNKDSSLTEVIQAIESTSLFGTDKLIIAENLLAKMKDYLLKNIPDNLVIWEGKELSEATTKPFKAEIKNYKVSSIIFKFLDSLDLVSFRECIKQEASELVFYMLCRQIRMLIQAKSPGNLKGHPFMQQKLQNQAKRFSIEKLLELHQELYDIDKKLKTGKTPLGLDHEIEMWLLKI